MRRTLPWVLFAAAAFPCCQRAAPPAAGEVERPEFDAPAPAVPQDPLADFTLVPRSAGDVTVAAGVDDVAVGDGPTCTITALNNGNVRWRRSLPECLGRLELAWTPGSTLLARADRLLVAVRPDGAEAWRLALEEEALPSNVRGVAALADSTAVLALSPTLVVGVSREGREVWRTQLAPDEPLVTSPLASPAEGVVLLGEQVATFLRSDGSVRGRLPLRP
jgi:hypothetical protein